MKHTKSYVPNHPNPQFSRENFINLNGDWGFCFDDDNNGIANNFNNGFKEKRTIVVPYSYEYPSSNINETKYHKVLWYQKELSYVSDGLRWILHFEGSDYETNVYVNGQLVGNHIGGYTAFKFDITNYLKNGTNLIVVRIYDDFDATRSRGKQRWMDKTYECFYIPNSGINKTVWLEKVAETNLEAVRITPSFNETNVEMEYEINGNFENCEIETIISFDDFIISKERKIILRPCFKQTFDITSDNSTMKIHAWTPNYPLLYDVEYNIYKDNKKIDTVKSYFGVSEFSSKGNKLYLNRDSLFPKLILNQGYSKEGGITLTEQEMIKDIALMQEIGFNGNRVHQKIESQLFYYYCDALGFLLWQELPSAYEWKTATIKNLADEWVDILLQHHNHPSIMTNVIINESWGTWAIRKNVLQQEFVTGLYHLTKSLEPNRFAISNDGWEHTVSDILTFHNYASTYKELLQEYQISYENIHLGIHNSLGSTKDFESCGYNNGIKPVMLTEFGGIAFVKDKNRGWGYGNLEDNEESFLRRFKEQMDAIYDSNLFTGYCFTQLSDVQQEVNGLVDENRNFKVNKEELKKIISRKL